MPKTKAFSKTNGGAGADDFKKKRVKLGKRVAKPTATDTKFKAARIHMVQNMEQDKGAIVTSRNIALADLLHHCSHHATAMRADSMRGLLEIIQAHPSVLQSHGCQISDAVCACLADLSKEVRHTALLPLQHILRLAGPSSSALMADCACTHVGRGLCDTAAAVQDDALAAAKMIISLAPTAASHHAPLLLNRVLMILGTAAADAANTEIRLRVMAMERRVEVCYVLRQLLKLCAAASSSASCVSGDTVCCVAYRLVDDHGFSAAGVRGSVSMSSGTVTTTGICPVIARLLVDAWRELELNFADDNVQLPALLADSLLAVVKLQQQQQQQHRTPVSCWIPVMNSINIHIHTPVSAFLRNGRLHSSWLTPLSAVTAAFLRLCVLADVDAPLPAAVWDVCKKCVQARPTEALAEVCCAALHHRRLLPELADGGCITLTGQKVDPSDMSSTFWQAAAAAWGVAGGSKGGPEIGEDGIVMVGEALLGAVERHAQAALVNGVGKVPTRWDWIKPALLAAPRLAFTGPQRITHISLRIIIAAITQCSPSSLASETWAETAGKKLAPIFRAKLKTGVFIKGPFGSWSETLQRLAIQAATLHPLPSPDLISAICDAVCSPSVSSSVAMLAMTSVVQRHQAHGPALCLSFAMSLAAKRSLADVPEIAVCLSALLHSQSLADHTVLALSSASASAAIASAAAEEPGVAMPLLLLLKHIHLLLPKHYLGPTSAVGGGCCVEAVSRAFAIPLQPSSAFVDLAAQVLGQSCELLDAYLQAAAAVAARSADDAAAASAVALTVLAIARHPSLENSIRSPNILRAFSAFASGEGGGAAATGARSALMQEVKALHMLAPMP